jgi:hypothetical protein
MLYATNAVNEDEMRRLKASSSFGVTKATLRTYVKTNSFHKVRGVKELRIMSKLELEQEIVVAKLPASTQSGPP